MGLCSQTGQRVSMVNASYVCTIVETGLDKNCTQPPGNPIPGFGEYRVNMQIINNLNK